MSRGLTCGESVSPRILSVAPSTWEGVDCKLVTNELYDQEKDKIKIQWCKEVETKCTNLPQGIDHYLYHY